MTDPSRASEFLSGMKSMIPLIIGAIPFGIIFGTLAETSGLSFWGAIGFSSIVFAGSSQFIALSLISGGAGIAIIVLTTFVVNLRHMLYAATLVKTVRHLNHLWRVFLAFWLTDETFAAVAVDNSKQELAGHRRVNAHWFYLGSCIAMYGNWQLCTLIGLFLGSNFPSIGQWGLEFAMSATFIGMVTPYLAQKVNRSPMWVCVIVSGVASLVFAGVPNKLGLIIAAGLGIAAGYAVKVAKSRREVLS